jgi:prepilin-type N-terminal cleavage/methylation domain-containing protein
MVNSSRQRGYNLVEVLIAMGLLSTVLLSIVTLFYMGRSNVYSGKEMTAAVSMGTRCMEDFSQVDLLTLYSAFNIDPTDTTALSGTTVTVDSALPKSGLPYNTYAGSLRRSTDDITIDSAGACATGCANDPGGFLARWKYEMDANLKFANGSVTMVITPTLPYDSTLSTPTSATLSVATATMARVRILVRWVEEPRARQVILDTVKTNRPNPPS